MGYLSSPKGSIYYQDKGEGTPVLLLHGLCRSSRFWSGFDQELSQYYRVITMDSRGLGRTGRRAGWTDRTQDLADDAIELLNQLGIKKTHVVGQSLGGMVAISLSLKCPERIISTTVVNASSGGTHTLRVTPTALGAMAVGTVIRPLLCPLMVHTCTGGAVSPTARQRFKAVYENIVRDEGLPWLTTLKQMVTAMRFQASREGVSDLRKPTLVIYGEDDRFVPPENSLALFRLLPEAELYPIRGGGHELPMDQPSELSSILRGFIGRLAEA